ncbi:RNA-directed DNA polymerase, eukaryota, reverse transcriptase zinc-binding domain protein [Tanacetum coccineum]
MYPLILCFEALFSLLKGFSRDIYGDHVVSCAGIIGIKHHQFIIMLCAIPLWTSVIVQEFQLTGMANFMPGRAVIDAAQRKRVKYMTKCAAIGYRFLPFSFSSLGELEDDAVTLLKRIRKLSMTQDIGARAAIHIFNRISFAIAKGVRAQKVEILSRPSNSCWINIIKEVRRLEENGINLLLFMKKKLGNGLSTLFWDDVWCDGGKLKNRFPRAYALENSKQITVGQKLAHPSLYHSFRRHPRGGLELTQVEELAKVINPVVLTQSPDSWSWTLNNSGGYTVASSRNMIDSRLLPKGDLKTRWIRYVPNKVNTFAWKVMTNSLPTRFNISRRGIDIESLSCVNCDVGIETNDHLFFACNTAKKISKLINRWWDVPFMDINSYGEWRSWIDNVKLPKKNKSMFQGIYFVMWWLLWNFRNKKMFEAKPKSKETFFDEIICSSYYWCRYRCNTLFSWDDCILRKLPPIPGGHCLELTS